MRYAVSIKNRLHRQTQTLNAQKQLSVNHLFGKHL
jgi:hypothetical protein